MGLAILGMGTAVPPQRVSRDTAIQAAKILANCDADQAASLTSLYNHTGIDNRFLVFGHEEIGDILNGTRKSGSPFVTRGPGEMGPDTAQRMKAYEREALPLAWQAARLALRDAQVDPTSVTHLVTVSCTGFSAPGFDIGLIKKLGLPAGVARTHIGFMGCHGACNGLRVARAFAEAQRGARVLVCATELSSLHFYYSWNPKRMVGNALFGDGAAAAVACPAAEAPPGAWRLVANASCLFPNSEKDLTWSIGNHGFDMALSTRVPHLIAEHLRGWLEGWLADLDLDVARIGSWAIHPGGPRILQTIEETLGLESGKAGVAHEILREYGNMSSPTILFILDRLRRRAAPLPCVALAFGPGMVVEGMLFTS